VTGSALPAVTRGRSAQGPCPCPSGSIFFDFDSYVVKDEYRPVLEAHAGYLDGEARCARDPAGNADERGSRDTTGAGAEALPKRWRKALAVLGVSDAQMEAVSFGEGKAAHEADQ